MDNFGGSESGLCGVGVWSPSMSFSKRLSARFHLTSYTNQKDHATLFFYFLPRILPLHDDCVLAISIMDGVFFLSLFFFRWRDYERLGRVSYHHVFLRHFFPAGNFFCYDMI